MKLLAFDMFGEVAMNYDFGALDAGDFTVSMQNFLI